MKKVCLLFSLLCVFIASHSYAQPGSDNGQSYFDGNGGDGQEYSGQGYNNEGNGGCPPEQRLNDCYCLHCRYQPCYYNKWNCNYVPKYCYKKCCRYVDQCYQKQCCKYVPQYYCKTCTRKVPEYYYTCSCKYEPKYSCEKCCKYVPQYYYKRVCCDSQDQGSCGGGAQASYNNAPVQSPCGSGGCGGNQQY